MPHYLFDQLAKARSLTLKAMDGVTEEMADRIPEGFRNHIRWNLGHLYVVQERFAFQYVGLPLHMPDGFKEQFEYGTTPLSPPENATPPTLPELEALLRDQSRRIQDALSHRMQETVDPPYTTSAGFVLGSLEQLLSFNLYHEGMHVSVIRFYKKLLGV
ncbi:MAG: DinB family protein [Cohnella sp.]|nr:DinB family protein [Cohnella sp.]